MRRQLAWYGSFMLALAACGQSVPEELMVSDGYIRAPAPGAAMAAAYLTITGPEADRLTGAEIEGVSTTELHTVRETADGVIQMRRVDGYDLPAGGAWILEPGGNHLMLMAITQPLEVGQSRQVTLQFESGEALVLDLPVKPIKPGGGHRH